MTVTVTTTTRKLVLDRLPDYRDPWMVYFGYEGVPMASGMERLELTMSHDDWLDLGHPHRLTVTIEAEEVD